MQSIIWLEGILGAGKSSVTKELASRLQFDAVFEEVEDKGILKEFYENPQRMAFPFQIHLLHSRYNQHQIAAHKAVLGFGSVMDRSLAGDSVFANIHYKYGNITETELRIYSRCYETMAATLHPPTHLFFLDVPIELAKKRIQQRNRSSETDIPTQYLTDLREEYLNLLSAIEQNKHPWTRGVQIHRLEIKEHLSVTDITDWIMSFLKYL